MALTSENKIYAALAVLALLGGGVYLTQTQQRKEQERLTKPGAGANLPDFKVSAEDVEKITKIEIKNADKSTVTLEKTDDKWRVTKPVDYAANQANVKSVLDNLKEFKTKELIDPNAAAYGEYGLDDAKAVHVVAFKGTDKAADLYFGKSGGRGQMVRKGGVEGVYALSGYSSYQYTREVKNWRDNELLKFDEAAPTRIDLKNENGDFVFKKEGETWDATQKNQKIDRYDESKVKDLVRAFKALSAEDFADQKSDADTGLDKPVATLTITLKEGEPIKLAFGKTASGESRYLRKQGTSQVFIVSSWAAGWATAKVDKFQKTDEKKDAGGDDATKDEKKKDEKKGKK